MKVGSFTCGAIISGFWLAAAPVYAAGTVTVLYNDDPAGYGFNDTTAVTAATTLGQQRKNAMNAAAQFWGSYLNNTHPITINAKFLSNGNGITCNEQGGTLAYAGASTSSSNINKDTYNLPFDITGNVTALPRENTSYPIALAEELANNPNLNAPNKPYEVEAVFNESIGQTGCLSQGGWYYGYGADAAASKPAGHSSFYETARHELAHGLGFSSGVSQDGQRSTVTFSDGTNRYPVALDDPFMLNLKDATTGKLWPNMTDGERAASTINNGNLVWNGPKVTEKSAPLTAGKTNGQVRMFAPSPYQGGSSVSHFDTAVTPDELMEPSDTPTSVDYLTKALMCDIGWKGVDCVTATISNGSVAISGTAQVGETLTATVSDNDGYTSVTYQWSANGTAIAGATASTYVPVTADIGKTITVKATYTDQAGNAESPTSTATAAVTAAPNTAGTVSISGTPQVGQTLTATASDADGISGSINFQWFASGTAISQATGQTYVPTASDVGKIITVKATYTDNKGNAESPTSSPTTAVTAATTGGGTSGPGDAEGDGDIDVYDILAVINQVFSGQTKTTGADYDGDGDVDVYDILGLINKVFPQSSAN